MDKNLLSPYIRLTMHSAIPSPFVISSRIIYDYEIIYVKEGGCRIRVDGNDYICRKNNVVFLRPGVLHSFHSIENMVFVQPHIHFDAVYWEKSTITPISFKDRDSMTADEIALIQEDVFADVNIPYVFVPDDPAAFQAVFFHIVDSYKTETQLQLKADMLRLLDMILAQFEERDRAGTDLAAQTMSAIPCAIRNYIDGNYYHILTLDSMAQMFYINKFTMMRQFKAMYGTNIMKYYYNRRIAAAVQLLTNTNMSIRAIGEMLHFEDAYSFSRFFKQSMGVSPQKYRGMASK